MSPLLPLTMTTPRATHSATRLNDGRVLIAGGFREEGTHEIPLASAEIFDPTTNTFTPTGDLHDARSGHTATLLASGEVLIAGGWGVEHRLASAELYDPITGTFRFTASLAHPRASMTATALPTGQVVIIGGDSARNNAQLIVEIYDPALEQFVSGGDLRQARLIHSATLLTDGRILIAGGSTANNSILGTAEIYDPKTRQSSPTGPMHVARYKHAAVLLPDGDVLLIGGSNQNDWTGKYRSTEVYHPGTGMFDIGAPLQNERFKLADAATLLADGDVLVAGGYRRIERMHPNGQFISEQSLDNDYYYTVATPLTDGRVLITGGYDPTIQPTAHAWLYQ